MQGSSVPCRRGSSTMMAMAEDLGAFTVGTVVLQSGAQRRLRVNNGVEVVRGAIAVTRDT